jgi:hypothetical protein
VLCRQWRFVVSPIRPSLRNHQRQINYWLVLSFNSSIEQKRKSVIVYKRNRFKRGCPKMSYKTEPKRNKYHEIFCIADSDAQRSAQRHCSSLSGSFLLSFLVMTRYGGVSFGRACFRRGQLHFYFSFLRVNVNKIITLKSSDQYMYRTVVTILVCTTNSTFSNSTFCPHSVFMCFVWISEQIAIISLYSIN